MKQYRGSKRLLAWSLAVLLASIVVIGTAWADVPKMNIDTLKKNLTDPEYVIVDARGGSDWSSSEFKIQGAVRANPSDFSSWASKFPKDKTLVLYCA